MHVEGLDECFLLLGLHWNAAAYEIAYSTIAIRVVHYYSSTFFTGVFLSLVLSQVVYLKVRCALDVLKNCARMGCLCMWVDKAAVVMISLASPALHVLVILGGLQWSAQGKAFPLFNTEDKAFYRLCIARGRDHDGRHSCLRMLILLWSIEFKMSSVTMAAQNPGFPIIHHYLA